MVDDGIDDGIVILFLWFRFFICNLVSFVDGILIMERLQLDINLVILDCIDIKSVYCFIIFKKNWWVRKFNNILFLKYLKFYYIVCYLYVIFKI